MDIQRGKKLVEMALARQTQEDEEAFFLPSRAGKTVLIFRNNKFWVNNQYRDKLNWACRDKDSKACLCRVQTTMEGRFIRVKGHHTHTPNFTPDNFNASGLVESKFKEWSAPLTSKVRHNLHAYE